MVARVMQLGLQIRPVMACVRMHVLSLHHTLSYQVSE